MRYGRDELLTRDAMGIIDPGASNPVGVAGSLHEMMLFLSRQGGDTPSIKRDPRVRVVLDQLNNIVLGKTVAPLEDYEAVTRAYYQLPDEDRWPGDQRRKEA